MYKSVTMHGHMNVQICYDARPHECTNLLRCTVTWMYKSVTMHGHMNVQICYDARSHERKINHGWLTQRDDKHKVPAVQLHRFALRWAMMTLTLATKNNLNILVPLYSLLIYFTPSTISLLFLIFLQFNVNVNI